jgi:hypothetical protein
MRLILSCQWRQTAANTNSEAFNDQNDQKYEKNELSKVQNAQQWKSPF